MVINLERLMNNKRDDKRTLRVREARPLLEDVTVRLGGCGRGGKGALDHDTRSQGAVRGWHTGAAAGLQGGRGGARTGWKE
jgi:hypothetical protein